MDLTTAPIRVASASKVPATRHKVRRIAAPLVGDTTADNVELMVSEAVTNALVHGHGRCSVTVTVDEKSLRVEVRDDGPGLLVARRVDHGRGLAVIAALAARWELDQGDGGSCLWFEVDREADL